MHYCGSLSFLDSVNVLPTLRLTRAVRSEGPRNRNKVSGAKIEVKEIKNNKKRSPEFCSRLSQKKRGFFSGVCLQLLYL